MKKETLSKIMQMAWQFFKQTGISFSECLKKAWANYKLTKALATGIVRFYFQKVDGSIREAWGTLKSDLMPTMSGNDKRSKNNSVQVYFDTEKQEFRCFKKFNLVRC